MPSVAQMSASAKRRLPLLCRLKCDQADVKANCPLLLPIPSARSRSKYHEQRIARPRPTLGCQGLVTRLPRRWVGFGRGFLEHLRLSKGRSKAVAPTYRVIQVQPNAYLPGRE